MCNLLYGLILSYSISLEPVFEEGSIFPTAYNVVNQEKEYRGGIKVGLKFTPDSEPEEVLSLLS